MLQDLLEGTATGLPGILQLSAKFSGRPPDKNHLVLRWWKEPLWIARRHMFTRDIRGLMASVAAHAVGAMAVFAALHVLEMNVAVVPLKRRVARRMAVLAARKSENFVYVQECFAGGVGIGAWLWRRGITDADKESGQPQRTSRHCN